MPGTAASCEVWWASLPSIRPWHADLLDPAETARLERFRRPADRQRSLLGAALLRLAAGQRQCRAPAALTVDRSCPQCGAPHGRPQVAGLHVSVSHSGDLVTVAVTEAGPVGVDVEQITGIEPTELAASVLTAAEAGQVADAEGFLRLWTRKEAVLKATGDGLAVPMTDIEVTGPREAARLLRYASRPGLAVQLHDLAPATGYLASVAVLASAPVAVRERDAASLLAQPPQSLPS